MRYFAKYDAEGRLIAVGCGNGGHAISKAEYDELRRQIRQKALLVEQLCEGSIAISDVPTQWQAEIQTRADARMAEMNAETDD